MNLFFPCTVVNCYVVKWTVQIYKQDFIKCTLLLHCAVVRTGVFCSYLSRKQRPNWGVKCQRMTWRFILAPHLSVSFHAFGWSFAANLEHNLSTTTCSFLIPWWRKAFFTREFCASNPSEYSLVECLAGNVEEQAKLLGEVLELHGTLAPEPLQPLHERLIELYGEMKIWMVKSQLMSSIGRFDQINDIFLA